MTQQQALEVKDLAKDVVEALGVVTKINCPECKGTKQKHTTRSLHGWRGTAGQILEHEREIVIDCLNCSGTGKLSWKWEPKVGDICTWTKGYPPNLLFIMLLPLKPYEGKMSYYCWDIAGAQTWTVFEEHGIIPILPWEELERMLLRTPAKGGCWNFYEPFTFKPDIFQGTFMRWRVRYMWRYERTAVCPTEHFAWGKSRQEAVMRSIIALGKEITK